MPPDDEVCFAFELEGWLLDDGSPSIENRTAFFETVVLWLRAVPVLRELIRSPKLLSHDASSSSLSPLVAASRKEVHVKLLLRFFESTALLSVA